MVRVSCGTTPSITKAITPNSNTTVRMETIKLRDEYIKLGQALKAAGLCESGVDAKYAIEDDLVKVNGNVEYQRGKKLRDGDEVTFQGETIRITL